MSRSEILSVVKKRQRQSSHNTRLLFTCYKFRLTRRQLFAVSQPCSKSTIMTFATMDQQHDTPWVRMERALELRDEKGTRRRLYAADLAADSSSGSPAQVDFSSNDYLGLARSERQIGLVEQRVKEATKECVQRQDPVLGATGSRLLSGDSVYHYKLERYLAKVHAQSTALLFNSGYDANLSVVSSLACNVILYDEYIHNSLHMGLRLWRRDASDNIAKSFKHNDLNDLQRLLKLYETPNKTVVIIVESVYSMDGDLAPLTDIFTLAETYNAKVVVDEAHGIGICGAKGTGLVAQCGLESSPALLCSIFTFGKAPGCHGAVVCSPKQVFTDYLINFAYPFVYSTALPLHSLITIQCSYETMTNSVGDELRRNVVELIKLFRTRIQKVIDSAHDTTIVRLLDSSTPIQALIVPGNTECVQFCHRIYAMSRQRIRLFPIRSPTVPAGSERVRIIIHAHNTREQVHELTDFIGKALMMQTNKYPPSKL